MSYNNGSASPGTTRAAVTCRGKTVQSISGWTPLIDWKLVRDDTGSFDARSGVFVAPVDGMYAWALGNAVPNATGNYIGLSVFRNDEQFYSLVISTPTDATQYLSNSGIIELLKGDKFIPHMYAQDGMDDVCNESSTWFSIVQLNTIF